MQPEQLGVGSCNQSGGYGDNAAVGHGVAGIGEQIEQHLLQQGAVTDYMQRFRAGKIFKANALRQQLLAKQQGINKHTVQLQRFHPHKLLPAEGQHTAGKVGTPFNSGDDLLQAGINRITGIKPFHCQPGVV